MHTSHLSQDLATVESSISPFLLLVLGTNVVLELNGCLKIVHTAYLLRDNFLSFTLLIFSTKWNTSNLLTFSFLTTAD